MKYLSAKLPRRKGPLLSTSSLSASNKRFVVLFIYFLLFDLLTRLFLSLKDRLSIETLEVASCDSLILFYDNLKLKVLVELYL